MDEYLTFTLAGDCFAFSIKDVDSVVEASDFTRLPNTAPYMRGIMNLRGKMIPVIDLRLKFGLAERAERTSESVIVLSCLEGTESRFIGAIADDVQEVIFLSREGIEAPPAIATANKLENSFVSGIGKKDDTFIVILDAGVACEGFAAE